MRGSGKESPLSKIQLQMVTPKVRSFKPLRESKDVNKSYVSQGKELELKISSFPVKENEPKSDQAAADRKSSVMSKSNEKQQSRNLINSIKTTKF